MHHAPPADALPPDGVVPYQSYARLFLRFLRFGLLAWGGPVAQIAMIRQELVEEERWLTRERFNRALAVYQVLPGPEAHELCVYFGALARGRPGGLLAGLGFMLPGFLLMLALAWLYVEFGINATVAALFAGFQPAVAALIGRAVHRIGGHVLLNRWLWAIALVAGAAQLLGLHFLISFAAAGLAYVCVGRGWRALAATLLAVVLALALLGALTDGGTNGQANATATGDRPSQPALFGLGLKAGLLTFGGAYTAIPIVRRDAVESGGWLTDAQFLDSLALSGILPAPMIIFTTFTGYLGGGVSGAVLVTVGVFLPAFSFTLIGHQLMERLIANRAIHTLLDGITAGVVGLIAATGLDLLRASVSGAATLLIFALALTALYRWKAKLNIIGVMAGAGALGLLFLR